MADSTSDSFEGFSARLLLVEERLRELEQTIQVLSKHPEQHITEEQSVSVLHQSTPTAGLVSRTLKSVNAVSLSMEAMTASEIETGSKQNSDIGLEAKIGSYWLNRVGLLVVLVGVVSFLLYSFQFFGPVLKLSFGFVLAIALIYVSRSPMIKSSKEWFAQGLNALGWSIGFFSGYAMCFVPELQLVHSTLAGLIILIAFSLATMHDAIRARAEFTASLSTTFAAVSVCLATSSVDPRLALLVTVSVAAYVSIKQKWFSLLLYSTIAFYVAFNYCLYNANIGSNFYSTSMLLGAWLAIHTAVYFAQERSEPHNKKLIWVSVLNAVLASEALLAGMSNDDLKYKFASMGAVYLATANLYKRRDDEAFWTLHLLIGLSFVNISKWMQFTSTSPAVIDIMQLGLLTIIGLRFKIKGFRWFAILLAFGALYEAVNNGLMIGCLAVGVYGSCAYLYRHPFFKGVISTRESTVVSNVYLTLTNIISFNVIAIADAIDPGWKGCLWTVQMLANATVALKTHDSYINQMTGLMLIFTMLNLLWLCSSENKLSVSLAVIMLYAFAGYCRELHLQTSEAAVRESKDMYGLLAGVVLLCLLWRSMSVQVVAIALGVQGMVSIAGGFSLREKILRVSGLVAFAVMAFHLLFIDLASASTIARIISFIVSGLLLVGCSYGYVEFSKNLAESEII